MCGIVGIFSRGGRSVDEAGLRAGAESLYHRGPDSRNQWLCDQGRVGLAHARLSIIGLENGTQPLASENGSIRIVVNGEFYDHDAIRAECCEWGYRFQTDSDSEILIPLYQRYGMNCLEYLRGEFAFLLWDENLQTLFACRDRFGIKPLVFTESHGVFYAASEAKALFAMGVEARWNDNTVREAEYIVRGAAGTYFEGVENVRPGCYLAVARERVEEHTYWDFNYPDMDAPPRGYTEADAIAGFREVLDEAIRLRLRADVPVGCYLSGGLDSAAILGLMGAYARGPVDAYTIAFQGEGYDETAFAREMAAFTGINHRVFPVDEEAIARNLSDALWHHESPMINGHGVAKFLLSRHVRESGHRVVLTGEGADEVLAGYGFFREDLWVQQAQVCDDRGSGDRLSQLRANNQVTAGIFDGGDPDADLSAVESQLGYIPTQLRASTLTAARLRKLHAPDSAAVTTPAFAPFLASLGDAPLQNKGIVDRSLYLHAKSVLPNYILTVLGDRSEMAHSVEGRVPFLDHKVVEFLVNVPLSLKIKGTTEKFLLREAVRDRITERLYRREKHPFVAPPPASNRASPLKMLMGDVFHGSELRDLPFYDQRKVIELFDRWSGKHGDSASPGIDVVLMTILSLCLMQQRFKLRL